VVDGELVVEFDGGTMLDTTDASSTCARFPSSLGRKSQGGGLLPKDEVKDRSCGGRREAALLRASA
jgi:hypothetical protein